MDATYLMDGATAVDCWAHMGEGARSAVVAGWVDRGEYRLSVRTGGGAVLERTIVAPSIESAIASVRAAAGDGEAVSLEWAGPLEPGTYGVDGEPDGLDLRYASALSDLYLAMRRHPVGDGASSLWDVVATLEPTACALVDNAAAIALPADLMEG